MHGSKQLEAPKKERLYGFGHKEDSKLLLRSMVSSYSATSGYLGSSASTSLRVSSILDYITMRLMARRDTLGAAIGDGSNEKNNAGRDGDNACYDVRIQPTMCFSV